jgi:hypothetical protein
MSTPNNYSTFAPVSVSASVPAATTISLAINGVVVVLFPNEHNNAQDLWWHILDTTYGMTRPKPGGVGVDDMAAFIRDAVPLPCGKK